MTAHLLTRHSHRRKTTPELPLLGDLGLALARCHEFCGNSRRTLAMMAAGQFKGPVFWISLGWSSERLNPDGMRRFANPGRFTFVTPRRAEDVLWTMEEVLRSGAVPLVVADIPAPPALTPVRRLHLAAETGAREGTVRPVGVLLTPDEGGAQGIESRWHMAGAHDAAGLGWTLTRLRARTDPPKSWHVAPQNAGFGLTAKSDRA
ncbi:MAG: ImuA family protein [Marinosulfonomonas sp.]